MKIVLPEIVKMIIDKIEENGFEAYIVGGCVRDYLMGLTPHDWDICTQALPENILEIFSDFTTFDSGIKHGTVSVVVENAVYEITTFRLESEYSDNRHPDHVEFTKNICDDLARRDFTINAIAYSERTGIIDLFDGVNDIKNRVVRCVGNPDERFTEDSLRILRGLRFASVYNLSIEKQTAKGILKNAKLLNNISVERITKEFDKLICGDNFKYILRRFASVFATFLPEIEVMFDYDQHTKHHNRNLWRHTTCAMEIVPAETVFRITMLFHDIGKPVACKRDFDGICHYKGHEKFSATITEVILNRLKYSKDFIDTVTTLIKFHDVRLSDNKSQIKHLLNVIGAKNLDMLMAIQYADIMSQSMFKREEKLLNYEKACLTIKSIVDNKECYSLKQLAINGHDLIHLGITDGKKIGDTLAFLLNSVIEEKIPNEKEFLISQARLYNL